MLYWLAQQFQDLWGPMRLLQSHIILSAVGVILAGLGSYWVLKRWSGVLPADRGRAHAIDAPDSIGKPTGAGALFIPVTIVVGLLVTPWDPFRAVILLAVLFAMGAGFLDDRSSAAWGRLAKGTIDLLLSIVVAWAMIGG